MNIPVVIGWAIRGWKGSNLNPDRFQRPIVAILMIGTGILVAPFQISPAIAAGGPAPAEPSAISSTPTVDGSLHQADTRPGGSVELSCKVARDGRLEHCMTRNESPPDQGFASEALELSKQFKFKRQTIQGEAVEGGIFTTVIRFKPVDERMQKVKQAPGPSSGSRVIAVDVLPLAGTSPASSRHHPPSIVPPTPAGDQNSSTRIDKKD